MNDPKKYANNEIEDKLQNWFSDFHRVVIAGIGNSLRKDDFVGVKIVGDLKKRKMSSSILLIECETVPESFIEEIVKFNPSHILITDAAMISLKPGSSKLTTPEELQDQQAVSTHVLPLRILCEYLAQTTMAKIALLLIQPEDTGFGEGLTEELEKTAERLADILSTILDVKTEVNASYV